MQTFGKIVKEFEDSGVVTNIERPVYHRFAGSAENITNVSESVAEDPNVPISRRSQELGLHLDQHLHPYKVQLSKHRQFGVFWSYDNRLFSLLLKDTTLRICGFKKTVSYATQLKRIWLYCKRHLLAA